MNAVIAKPFTASKPLVAALAAGCIALPASTGAASVVAGHTFHLLPANVAEVSLTAPVELTAITYANLYNLAVATGNVVAAGLGVVFLPLSVGYLVLTLQSSQVPAYVKGVVTNVGTSITGLVDAFAALFAGGLIPAAVPAAVPAATSAVTSNNVKSNVTAAVKPSFSPLSGLTYANLYNLAVATGNVVAAGLGVVFLPLSVGYLVLTLQSSQVPAYVKGVVTNVGTSITGLVDAIGALLGIGALKIAPVKAAAVKAASVTSTATPKATQLVTLKTTQPVKPATVKTNTSSVKLAATKKTTHSKPNHTTSGTSGKKTGKSSKK